MKNRLQLADETIAILRSSNSQLDRNLSVLQSDFSVLESLLIESGQTLQRLQEMVRLSVNAFSTNVCAIDILISDLASARVEYQNAGTIQWRNTVKFKRNHSSLNKNEVNSLHDSIL
jgi:DNA-binding response OmpR family regulator